MVNMSLEARLNFIESVLHSYKYSGSLQGSPNGYCGIAAEYLHSYCLQASDLTIKLVGLLKHPREIGVLHWCSLWADRGDSYSG